MRSDSKPAILALKDASRMESGIPEGVPAGDHQASGLIENAIKNAQRQFRGGGDILEEEQREGHRSFIVCR